MECAARQNTLHIYRWCALRLYASGFRSGRGPGGVGLKRLTLTPRPQVRNSRLNVRDRKRIAQVRQPCRACARKKRAKPRKWATNEPNLDAGIGAIQDIIRIHVKSFRKPIATLDNVAMKAKRRPGGRGCGRTLPRNRRNTRKGSNDKREPHRCGSAARSVRSWDSAFWSHYLEGTAGRFRAGDQSWSRTLAYRRLKTLKLTHFDPEWLTTSRPSDHAVAGACCFCESSFGLSFARLGNQEAE